jgi:hypothetical protein
MFLLFERLFRFGFHPMGFRWLLLVLAIAIVAVAHSFWIIIGKNPSGDACNGRPGLPPTSFLSLIPFSGIDDFDDVGVSLFSAFNMLVLGVFQIETVRLSNMVLITFLIIS